MRLISVNVGLPRTMRWNGEVVETGIVKEPINGPVMVRRLNLEGDGQADLTVHGGVEKAVYAYASEHYDLWRKELGVRDLPWGMFGENLTTAGLSEDTVNIGDRFRIGSCELIVTQPRMPCYKLGLKFGRNDIIKRFAKSGRSGFYLAVTQEGVIQTGDRIELVSQNENRLTVAAINRRLYR
jgi:MOSC domain-containing protein YiiM